MTSPLEEARKAALEAYKTERAKWRVPSIPDNIAAPLTDAAIDAYESRLKALGYVMAPREASKEMISAAQDVEISPSRIDGGYGSPDPEEIKKMIAEVWSAMLSAVSEE